jgi:HSP20 family molecular chaperone IbpA
MKRMYVILLVIFLLFLMAVTALGQMMTVTVDNDEKAIDHMKKQMLLRDQIHKRLRDKLFYGVGPDQDLFKDLDEALEESMNDSFSGFGQMGHSFTQFKSEWSESKNGRILTLTPQSQDQKLNIDVNASMITIKGESQQKSSTSTVSSSFTNSFPVPDDCDGTKVKMDQRDGKILIELPFKKVKSVTIPPIEEERQPLPSSGDEIKI